MQIHPYLIEFVVLRSFDVFDMKSIQLIVIWLLLLFCIVLNGLRRNSTFLIVLMSNRCKFILIWSRLYFCVLLMFWHEIDAIHCNLITFVVLRCFEWFATWLNIFDRFDVKSIQIHPYLIAFVVLRSFDVFDMKSIQFIVIWLLL